MKQALDAFLPPPLGEGRGGGTAASTTMRRFIEGLPPSQPSPGRGMSKTANRSR
jgi:ATP-dependent helicase Lhr and Lhr-like helicase